MIKKLIFVFIALVAIQNQAQESVASPYSFYGVGTLKFKGTVENVAMGGIGVYKDSIHINLQNPATYGGNNLTVFNNKSRPVKFSLAGSHSKTKLNAYTASDNVQTSTFDYLALAIPIGKLGFGFGLMPYTSVGYKLENKNAKGEVNERFTGTGGVNQTYLSFGYQFKNGLSIGVEGNYKFGATKNSTIQFLYNDEGELLQLQSLEDNRSNLSGFGANLGMHYFRKVSKDLELQSSITYTPQSKLRSTNQRDLSLINVNVGQSAVTNAINLEAKGLAKTKITLPSKYTFGAGVGKPKKWFAGVEYSAKNAKNFKNEFIQNSVTVYENASKLAFGGFYIPKYNSPNKYWKRMVYRAGVRTENTGLNVNGKSIKEFGMSFGLGLPVGRLFSNANFTFEYGSKGTTTADLVRENFMNFQLSLSLNDRWFVKRKYD